MQSSQQEQSQSPQDNKQPESVHSRPIAGESVSLDHVPKQSEHALSDNKDTSDDRVLIYLDCLLDTKLGCIAQNDPELAATLLRENLWSDRIMDNWPGRLTNKKFRQWYDSRNFETLKHSVLTNVNYFLKRMIKDSIVYNIHTNATDKVVFEVNIWPYESPDDAFIDMLVECVRFHTYSTSTIVIISADPKTLTPEYIDSRYRVVIDQNPMEWVSMHKEFFEEKGIPNVTVVAPALLDPDVDLEEMRKQKITPAMAFDEFDTFMQPLFKLRTHPASMFSITEAINEDTVDDVLGAVAIEPEDIKNYILSKDPTAVFEDVPINKEIVLDITTDPDNQSIINKENNEPPNKPDKTGVDDDPFSFESEDY